MSANCEAILRIKEADLNKARESLDVIIKLYKKAMPSEDVEALSSALYGIANWAEYAQMALQDARP